VSAHKKPWMGNLIGREVRAAGGAIVAMAVLQLVLTLSPTLSALIFDSYLRFDTSLCVGVWAGAAVVVGLLLGVICGAEEQENGTADFASRLPIAPWRILLEKTCGSALAFIIWAILSVVLVSVAAVVCQKGPFHVVEALFSASRYDVSMSTALNWTLLLYMFGLAAGAWMGHVIPAAIAGGGAAALYTLAGIYCVARPDRGFAALILDDAWTPPILWAGCLAALLVALGRFQTREAT
jgi:hypothetical protein